MSEGRGGADGRMARWTEERDEMQMNERMKTRETKGVSGNTKKRRKRLLAVSAEEQYAGGGYESSRYHLGPYSSHLLGVKLGPKDHLHPAWCRTGPQG